MNARIETALAGDDSERGTLSTAADQSRTKGEKTDLGAG
jgi:hypothetical protein